MKIEDMISLARSGDKSAQEELIGLYRPYLSRVIAAKRSGKSNSRFSDSDVVQDACMLSILGLKKFQGSTEPEFTGWIRAILLNRMRELHRTNTAQARDERREVCNSPSRSAVIEWFVDTGPSPQSRAIQGENALRLLAALEELPANQRQAIELRYFNQKKLRQIAELMDSTPGAVAGLIRNGLEKLEKRLPKLLESST